MDQKDPLNDIKQNFIENAKRLGFVDPSERLELIFMTTELVKKNPKIKDSYIELLLNKKDKNSFIDFIQSNSESPYSSSSS